MDFARIRRRHAAASQGGRRGAPFVFILAVLVLLLLAGEAQAFTRSPLIWTRRIGTSTSAGGAFAVAAGPNGVVAIAGYRAIEGTPNPRPLVAKYTAGGRRAWLRTFVRYQGQAVGVVFDHDGNVYAAVTAYRATHDIGVLKYDASGHFKWARFYDGTGVGNDEAVAIALDRAGNVVVAGKSPAGNERLGVAVLKYLSTGRRVWAARFDSDPADVNAGDVTCKDMALDSRGNAYVGGSAENNASGDWIQSAIVLKFRATSGVNAWHTSYVARRHPGSWADAIAVRGSWVVIAGATAGPTDQPDALVVKYTLTGTEQYWNEWGEDGLGESFHDVALDEDGNVYVTGGQWLSWRSATDKAITMLLKPTLSGPWWVQPYQPAATWAEGWFLTRDGLRNLYVSGIIGGSEGKDDFLTMKYSPSGVRLWKRTWTDGGADDDWPYGIVVGKTGGVYVTGWVTATGATRDFWQAALLKYRQ
jgi:hypothetical protein